MFLDKCISVLLSSVVSVNSVMVWYYPMPHISNETVTEVAHEYVTEEIVEEPIVESAVHVEPSASDNVYLTDSEIDLIALVTMAEAEGESEEGKRLVIDVILNRYDSPHFPDTIEGVVYAKNAFECVWNGRIDICYIRDDIRQLVLDEIRSRTNSNIHYFRTNYYHSFGTPIMRVGNHYFSTY